MSCRYLQRSSDVVPPIARRARDLPKDVEEVLSRIVTVRFYSDAALGIGPECQLNAALNGNRENRQIVIINMFANEIDPSGNGQRPHRLTAEAGCKEVRGS